MLIAHRINTIYELSKIPEEYGVEIDVRDYDNKIVLSHDPFMGGELLEKYLEFFNHKFLIINVKSERIEYEILKILKKSNIENYFFLDSSFPMLINLLTSKINNVSLRFSEYEKLESLIFFKDKVNWVWSDCFTKNPLTKKTYKKLKELNFKICVVSPELQNRKEDIESFKKFFNENNILPDAICTKFENFDKWNGL